MALLHLFKEIIPSSYLHILHCNHGVRTEAHNDAIFVGEQAKLLRIPIQHFSRIDSEGHVLEIEGHVVRKAGQEVPSL